LLPVIYTPAAKKYFKKLKDQKLLSLYKNKSNCSG
jgi:hypothetical protein